MSLGGIVKPWPPMQTLTTDRKFRIGCNVNAGRRWSGIRNFGNGALGHVAVSSVRDSVFIEKAAPLPMRPLLSDSPTSHTACEARPSLRQQRALRIWAPSSLLLPVDYRLQEILHFGSKCLEKPDFTLIRNRPGVF
jgi:hypothetical protein